MSRLARLVVACVAAASTVALGAASAAGAGTHPGSAAAAARAARAVLRGMTANLPVTDQAVPGTRHRARGLTKVDYYNWAGYADDSSKGNTYSRVSGGWKQPRITCPSRELQVAVFWVGLDGFANSTVEQDGTIAECYLGRPHYYTWWEMYPANFIQVVGTTVRPGDRIAASVAVSGTTYTLKLTDATRSGNGVSETQTCTTCTNASAEWIAETPSQSRGYTPLPDFTRWAMSAASVTSGTARGINAFPDDKITLVGSGGVIQHGYSLAAPGPLGAGGTRFRVAWHNSY